MAVRIFSRLVSFIKDNDISLSLKSDIFSKKVLNVSEHTPDPRDWVHNPAKNNKGIDLRIFSRRGMSPPVKDQGSIGSCVGHSGRVVIGSSLKFKEEEPSSMWIYKTAKKYDAWAGEDYSGTSIRGAASALLNEGCCYERFWPYVSDESSLPLDGAKEDAAKKKIKSYHVIPCGKSDEIKRALLEKPLWYAFRVRSHFFYTKSNGIVNAEKYLSSDIVGGHAVCLIGWRYIDDNLYWEFQNSWGRFFGDKGYFFMCDELFQSHIINSIGPYYIEINEGFHNPKPDPDPKPDPKPDPGKKKNALILVLAFIAFGVLFFLFFNPENNNDIPPPPYIGKNGEVD
jgi:hypothetical protein